jgi:hypothetical protein
MLRNIEKLGFQQPDWERHNWIVIIVYPSATAIFARTGRQSEPVIADCYRMGPGVGSSP